MKKSVITAFALSALLVGGGLRADSSSGAPSSGPATGAGAGHMGQGLETMQATLGLSDAQVTQIKAVYESHHAALKTDGEQVKTDLEKLSGLVASKGSDSDLSAAISELKADRETERAERAKQMEEVDAILTPSQLAQRILAEAAKKEGEREEQRGGQRGPQ